MPKIRTHKSTSKRFTRTKGGKGLLMRTKLGKSHLRRTKSARVKRQFDETLPVTDRGTNRRVERLAPYMNKGK
ncbi:MAG: 50S ribosomal protein L35 [Anaerolineales bacterium]|nr:50S ribosomal protein L35 [Anaerolineales bacterium]